MKSFLLICCSCFCVWISNHASVLKGSHLYSEPCSGCINLLIVPQRLYFQSNIPGEEIWIDKMLHIKCSNFKLFLFSEQIAPRQVSIYFSVVFLRQVRDIPMEEMAGGFLSLSVASVQFIICFWFIILKV